MLANPCSKINENLLKNLKSEPVSSSQRVTGNSLTHLHYFIHYIFIPLLNEPGFSWRRDQQCAVGLMPRGQRRYKTLLPPTLLHATNSHRSTSLVYTHILNTGMNSFSTSATETYETVLYHQIHLFSYYFYIMYCYLCLQCFDAVGRAAGRASGL